MKKKSKTTTSSAPLTKSLAPAPTPKPTVMPKPTVSPLVKRAAAAAVAPLPPPKPIPASKPSTTTIAANINVGFGNSLFIRGEGAGLSWDKGTLMKCVSDDVWSIALTGLTKIVAFKVLINDTEWSLGADYVAQPGTVLTIRPQFK